MRREQASEEAEIEEMEARFRDQLQELADRKEALRLDVRHDLDGEGRGGSEGVSE